MAHISKLTIQGFKSFKRKTSIPMLPGFTVFTGPNGSGKSNISESVSFAFGLMSRSLRAKKAHELIFNGGKDKEKADRAIVSVHFDNSRKNFPFEDPEVVLTRIINQSGASTYKVNGKTATKQQMVDILSQARVSPNGHNIIHQGDVMQVVDMMPVQRREIIDEISGIRDYDDKRAKAQKELDAVAEKLKEAEIILNERMQIIDRIKKDRDSAVLYKDWQQELDLVRASIIWNDYSQAAEEMGLFDSKIVEQEKVSGELEKEIKQLDSHLGDEEKALDDITSDVIKASGQLEVAKQIAKLNSEIDRRRDRMQMNLREIDRIKEMRSRMATGETSPAVKEILNMAGVEGTLESLITIPGQYRTAIDVAAGQHLKDVIVQTTSNATVCIKYLKEKKIGRARFLPLDKMQQPARRMLPKGAIGWLSDLIKYSGKHSAAVNYVFGTTACVDNIDKANSIMKMERVRMVTLDGDLVEASGAMMGGFMNRKASDGFSKDMQKLEEENEELEDEIVNLEKELSKLSIKEEKPKTMNFEMRKVKFDERIKKFREERSALYEKRLTVMQKLNDLKIQKARSEANVDNLKAQWDKYKELEGKTLKDKQVQLKERQKSLVLRIEGLGPINLKAVDEFESLKADFDDFKVKFDKIVNEKETVEKSVIEIEEKRKEVFTQTMDRISKTFKEVYKELTGGEAELKLEDQMKIDSGLLISASPSGKRLLNIDSMSGGEKTLTALGFLFAIQRYKPSPFYILDEADAALDRVNSKKLADMIRKQSKSVQFIVVSHNDEVIKEADQVYGLSMDQGESKLIGIKLPQEN